MAHLANSNDRRRASKGNFRMRPRERKKSLQIGAALRVAIDARGMWIRGIGAMVTLVGSSLCADETGGQMERSPTVCMQGGHPLVMEYARYLVPKTFGAIGVRS